MSYNKRSRSTFEADNHHAPFAIFGTPLPDDSETRDDGSYVPIWKQEVKDERGRKRLHGAFTGGFSAGYFNTVGSKEGWTPSTFVSSRNKRHKDAVKDSQQRPEDYMDDEDLADQAEAQKLQTSQAFAGLGTSTQDEVGAGGLLGLLRTQGDTMGQKLLRRMGWKDGQGIGPKIRRNARLDMKSGDGDQTYLFAPDDVAMIRFNRKTDQKGLGHQGAEKLPSLGQASKDADADDNDDGTPDFQASRNGVSLGSTGRKKSKVERGGIGVGILNDDGSDDEDPYEIGPKIKYNRVIGGDKKKKKKVAAAVNPSLGSAPVFLSKTARAGIGLQRCHDGRLPLDGFVMAKITEDFSAMLSEWAPHKVPEGWVSSKQTGDTATDKKPYLSTSDAAKASSLDPRSRAALLGEKALPGKSVFDYISGAARDKLATASGNTGLPQGRGEIPEEYRLSEEETQKRLWDQIPKLDREAAAAAISRSAGGPYADNEIKRERYRAYLESQVDATSNPPARSKGMSDEDFLREMNEFYNCARIFKPMTGFMASRFTTSKTMMPGSGASDDKELLSKPEPRAADPAEEAAKMGMFGGMTRSIHDFYPTRLLCKRFNVKPPAHVQPDNDSSTGVQMPAEAPGGDSRPGFESKPGSQHASTGAADQGEVLALPMAREEKVDLSRNEAVEGTAAQADVLRAIFGDSDSE